MFKKLIEMVRGRDPYTDAVTEAVMIKQVTRRTNLDPALFFRGGTLTIELDGKPYVVPVNNVRGYYPDMVVWVDVVREHKPDTLQVIGVSAPYDS